MISRRNRKSVCGQVIVEYALMLVLFTVVSLSLLFLLSALMGHGWRVLSLVAWEL